MKHSRYLAVVALAACAGAKPHPVIQGTGECGAARHVSRETAREEESWCERSDGVRHGAFRRVHPNGTTLEDARYEAGRLEGEIFPERAFRGVRIVAEGGIRYQEERRTMLIFEYCTRANFNHGGVMKSKITRYIKYLPEIEGKVRRNVTVLFVLDIDHRKVAEFVERVKPILDDPVVSGFSGEPRYPFFFTDYQTFKSVPVGKALGAKIYFWHDGKEWMLSGDN